MPVKNQVTKTVWVPLGVLLKVIDKAQKYNIILNILDTDHDEDEVQLQMDCEAADKSYIYKIKDLVAEYKEDQEDEQEEED